ncbi:Hint domain-containing protein [Leisingera methylohalidivorans]|nr:Hint domain-containing protein [Leisingera methylohalidivorans]
MPIIKLYDWSLYTMPSAIPMSDIEGDSHANDPDSPDYNASAPTWIGETFTFNGGSGSQIDIVDDDGQFEDGYVETGGAQTLGQDVTINGVTYLAGSVVENEFSMLDAAGNEVFVVRIDGVNVGFGYPEGQEPVNGTSFTAAQGRDGDPVDSGDGTSTSSEPYANIVCYAPGTMIDTPDGPRPVETLKPGDLVLTRDHGPQLIRWARCSVHPLEEVEADAKPVQIKAEALGPNLPAKDLIVSPQHRIFVGGNGQLDKVFTSEAFAPAKSLTAVPGIRHMKGKRKITWVHFACDRHEVVTANGCLSESLLLGPMVVNGLTAAERRAVVGIFGRAPAPNAALNGPPALDCLTVGTVRRQIAKQRKDKDRILAKEIQKWDLDLAMEKHEAERFAESYRTAQSKARQKS